MSRVLVPPLCRRLFTRHILVGRSRKASGHPSDVVALAAALLARGSMDLLA